MSSFPIDDQTLGTVDIAIEMIEEREREIEVVRKKEMMEPLR